MCLFLANSEPRGAYSAGAYKKKACRPSIKDRGEAGLQRQDKTKHGRDDYGHPKLKSLFVHIFAFNSLERIISDHEHPEIVLD